MIKAIAIDDEPLALKVLENFCASSDGVELEKTFTEVGKAYTYLEKHQVDLIFVDIQMPVMNGFDFMESFEQMPAEVKTHYVIYMLSSSINENDIAKVRGYPSVKQFLNKPLTVKTMSMVLEDN